MTAWRTRKPRRKDFPSKRRADKTRRDKTRREKAAPRGDRRLMLRFWDDVSFLSCFTQGRSSIPAARVYSAPPSSHYLFTYRQFRIKLSLVANLHQWRGKFFAIGLRPP